MRRYAPDGITLFTLAFDDFGWAELKGEADAAGCSVQELVGRAIERFTAELDGGEGWMTRVPELPPRPCRRETTRVEVEVTRDQEERLGLAARRQGVSVPRLVEHAVIVYLAAG